MTGPGLEVSPLHPGLDLSGFDCGNAALDRYLRLHALANQQAHCARTYVAHRGGAAVGFYSLAAGAVEHAQAPERVRKGLPAHSIPVMLLARLAVDRREQGRGLGAALLKDALKRTASAAGIAGMRAVLVHAKDEHAAAFYRRFDFTPSPFDPLCLYLLLKDLMRLLR